MRKIAPQRTIDVDLLIVGAGPVGCAAAAWAARHYGWSAWVIDRRPHIAGNCYDRHNRQGLLIHEYGPHYFRTDQLGLIERLSAFTNWIPGNYIVKSMVRGTLYPFPINLTTLELFFNRPLTPLSAERLLATLRKSIRSPHNSEDFVLSRVGRELYEAFYEGYTRKQWGRPCRELDPSVCGRIPVRLNRDERYVNQTFQLMPAKGYTALFANMLRHPNIRTILNTDYRDVRERWTPRKATLYCGPIDEFFNYRLGRLPWRSLRFEWEAHRTDYHQPCVQINYPNQHAYTRTLEFKHVTGQRHPETVITYEYPRSTGDPYYPILTHASRRLYEDYRKLAQHEQRRRRIYFTGRLAEFTYINTDQAIERGMLAVEQIARESRRC